MLPEYVKLENTSSRNKISFQKQSKMKQMLAKRLYVESVVYKSPETERILGSFVLYIPVFGLFSEKKVDFLSRLQYNIIEQTAVPDLYVKIIQSV